MGKNRMLQVMRGPLLENKWLFAGLAFILACETLVSLVIPQILSRYIDSLRVKGNLWLVVCALGYCFSALLLSGISTGNAYLSERLGWRLCDDLRLDLFKWLFSFHVQRHKTSQEGDFLERVEGDVNLLLGFFSTMAVDIINSLLLVVGIMVVFYSKFVLLGTVFSILSIGILAMFIRTQGMVSGLWKKAREKETDALECFSQTVGAYKDVLGIGKKGYAESMLENKFGAYERAYASASFWGNFPSTIFFSLLNIGEGIALGTGVYFLKTGQMSIGDVYLVMSYVGLLNAPFFSLKYEFSQIPKVLASLRRIEEVYGEDSQEDEGKECLSSFDKSVEFHQVSFGYVPKMPILDQVSFRVENGEHVSIEGRTGSGKSTILQMVAGLYIPEKGEVMVGGRRISDYRRESFNSFLYYILQNNPILEDSIKNNVTRYDDKFSDQQVRDVLEKVHLGNWLDKMDHGLHQILKPGNVSQDQAQLLAWAGAILKKPGILLADEFDAVIHQDTIKMIDRIVEEELAETTVIMVTHQRRSSMVIHKSITLENGKIVNVRSC